MPAWTLPATFFVFLLPGLYAQKPHTRFQTIGLEDGLSQSNVRCIAQDQYGFLWFGTQDGLNRYDGYTFKTYRNNPNNPRSVSSNWINVLYVDQEDNLWVATDNGVNLYVAASDDFTRLRIEDVDGRPYSDIRSLCQDSSGQLWIGSINGLLAYRNERLEIETEAPALQARVLCLLAEGDTLWIGTGDKGLFIWNRVSNEVIHYPKEPADGGTPQAPRGVIKTLGRDGAGSILMGSDQNGLFRADKADGPFHHYRHRAGQENSIADNSINALLADPDGGFWVATYKGVSHFDPGTGDFNHWQNRPGDPDSIAGDQAESLFLDRSDVLWVGINPEGISRLNLKTRRFKSFKTDKDDPSSLANGIVFSVIEASPGQLWASSGGVLNRLEANGTGFTHHLPNPPGAESTTNFGVICLYYDREKTLWVGGTYSGIFRFNPNTETFVQFVPEEGPFRIIYEFLEDSQGTFWLSGSRTGLLVFDRAQETFAKVVDTSGLLEKEELPVLFEDRQGQFWIGTWENGLARWEPEKTVFYRNDPNDETSLSHSTVLEISEDHTGRLWVGTMQGLNLFHPETGRFSRFTSADGLANDTINAILEDRMGQLWLSTNNGLILFDTEQMSFRTYNLNDGLQSNEFAGDSACVLQDGRLAFGGVSGLTLFDPKDIVPDTMKPNVALTKLRLFNEEVKPSVNGPLTQPIFMAKEIQLDHTQSVVSFEMSALHYADPGRNRYRYRLDGLHDTWIETDAKMRFATFTSLPARTYTLRVQAANKDGAWGKETSIRLVVHPPPWRTWWAFSGYAGLILLSIALVVRAQHRKLIAERSVVSRLRQLDRLKDEFLANSSHELRTPLHGIIGLAESLMVAGQHLGEREKHDLFMIVSSGKRLNGLVGEILDFAGLKRSGITLNLQPQALRALADATLGLARPLLGNKPIELINSVSSDLPTVLADENRLGQILWNLVHNAIKFTQKGVITLSGELRGKMVCIYVSDTGIGIPQEKQASIFHSFQQSDGSEVRTHGGIGIGLTLVQELVELHNGKIEVVSEPGKGTTFSLCLPRSGKPSVSLEETRVQHAALPAPIAAPPQKTETDGTGLHILIVDDESVNRLVIYSMLNKRDYRLSQAVDGPSALEILAHDDVDLVLLDIMMPGMSGYDVCRKIRETKSASELPVLFLSAKDRLVDLTTGFAAGCNDYLTKPVAREELLVRIKTHLDLLELNRDLEQRVHDRTGELHQRNRQIEEKNHELERWNVELETLDAIVRTINREIEFGRVVPILLEQGQLLFTAVQRAAFASYVVSENAYQVVTVVGRNLDDLKGKYYQISDVTDLEVENRSLGQGVYLIRDKDSGSNSERPKSRLIMTVAPEKKVEALIILDNLDDDAAFQESDLHRLVRFREHATAAVIKAQVLSDLAETQRGLVEEAHQAGMAEIAANVLHNVGNNLNSITTSVHVIQESFSDSKHLDLLGKLIRLLNEQGDQLGTFFSEDPRATHIPRALEKILQEHTRLWGVFRNEGGCLVEQAHELGATLREQHQYASLRGRREVAQDLNQLIEEALRLEAYQIRKRGIKITTESETLPPVVLEKSKFIRMLFFLLKNAREAIEEKGEPERGEINLTTVSRDGLVVFRIADNGIGIDDEHVDRVFAQGFTTKPNHRGLGLHYCANVMADLNGRIHVEQAEKSTGTVVLMEFQVQTKPAGG